MYDPPMKLLLLLPLLACATPAGTARGITIHASHYASMNGVRIGKGEDAMTCNRETFTGSHIVRWYCRTEQEGPQYELGVPIRLSLR